MTSDERYKDIEQYRKELMCKCASDLHSFPVFMYDWQYKDALERGEICIRERDGKKYWMQREVMISEKIKREAKDE